MVMSAILAAVAALKWTMPDGRVVEESKELVPFDGGERLEVGREEILARGAKRLDIVPAFAKATKGEAGYWFTPYGVYGEYDRDEGRFFAGRERMSMPMFGWSNPRGACLAASLKYCVRETVLAKKGEYTVAATLESDLCREPYENLVIEYHRRPAGTPYADLAKIYRKYQLDRGAVKPLREKIKFRPALRQDFQNIFPINRAFIQCVCVDTPLPHEPLEPDSPEIEILPERKERDADFHFLTVSVNGLCRSLDFRPAHGYLETDERAETEIVLDMFGSCEPHALCFLCKPEPQRFALDPSLVQPVREVFLRCGLAWLRWFYFLHTSNPPLTISSTIAFRSIVSCFLPAS